MKAETGECRSHRYAMPEDGQSFIAIHKRKITPMSGKIERNVNVTTVTEGEYKGTPTLSLPTDKPSWPFSFGIEKAKLIVANFDAIKSFVAKHNKPSADKIDVATLAAELGVSVERVQAMRNAGKI